MMLDGKKEKGEGQMNTFIHLPQERSQTWINEQVYRWAESAGSQTVQQPPTLIQMSGIVCSFS